MSKKNTPVGPDLSAGISVYLDEKPRAMLSIFRDRLPLGAEAKMEREMAG